MYDWKTEIDKWINQKQSDYSVLRENYLLLFEKAFENTVFPDKSWFGVPPTKNSLSLSLGSIFLVGIVRDNRLWIIVDSDLSDTVPYRFDIVKSSVASGTNIYWLEAMISDIKDIIINETIWEHYKIASAKVLNAPQSSAERIRNQTGKVLLSDFWNNTDSKISQHLYDDVLDKEIVLSRNSNQKQRLDRLSKAIKIPTKVESKSVVYLRNPDVVAEVLEKAAGVCAYCGQSAPFIKDSDGFPFLEVHHVVPLAEKGLDTIDNAVALCPNCHRHAHHGKSTFMMDKLKMK